MDEGSVVFICARCGHCELRYGGGHRRRNADKRGGGDDKLSLDEALATGLERPAILIAVDETLALWFDLSVAGL